MRVTLLSENLQKKLTLANRAISSRNQLPILSCVLLEAKEGQLTICGTDLEIGIETTVAAEVEETGAVAVPAKLFLELISSLPQDKISLRTEGTTLEVISKKTKTILQTSPQDEFPQLYEEKGNKVAQLTKGGIKATFGKILFAASNESTRPALSGVLFKKQENTFVVVATDGYRLSLDVLQNQGEGVFEKLLVPARLLREAVSVFEDKDVILYLSKKNNQLLFEQEGTLLVGRAIDAEFPSYEKIIPTDTASEIRVDREELLKAVKICAIFAREAANIITLSLQKDAVIVKAQSASLGENTVEVGATLQGEENQIAFNARYLLDVLTNIVDNDIAFSMTGPLNPGVFRIQGNPNFLHLIMPIRT